MLKRDHKVNGWTLFLICGLCFLGCSGPPEESSEAPKHPVKDSPTQAVEPTVLPSTGPIAIRIPDWVEDREEILKLAEEGSGDRIVQFVGSGENHWNVGLVPNDTVSNQVSYPWIEEKLNLYVNKILLAKAGTQSIPETWEEVLGTLDGRDQLEGMTAFLALPGNSPGMFWTITVISSLCGATSFSHPEEESVCVAVESLADLHRRGDYVLDHEKGLGIREAISELGRGLTVMTLAWDSDALILNDTRTSSVASQIKATSPPSFEVNGIREARQPIRVWSWVVHSASNEDEMVVDVAKRLSLFRDTELSFGEFVDSSSREINPSVKGGFFRLDPPSGHAVRETRRILLEGFKNRQSGLEILQGIQIRYEAIREHEKAQ